MGDQWAEDYPLHKARKDRLLIPNYFHNNERSIKILKLDDVFKEIWKG